MRNVYNVHFEIPIHLKKRMDKHLCWGSKSKLLRALLTAFLDRLDKEAEHCDPIESACDNVLRRRCINCGNIDRPDRQTD